jgi:hypothetical protein
MPLVAEWLQLGALLIVRFDRHDRQPTPSDRQLIPRTGSEPDVRLSAIYSLSYSDFL